MKKFFFALVVLVALAAIPAKAQIPVQQQRCYAQACLLSTWQPVTEGDTLVAIIRPTQVTNTVPCEFTPQGCGNTLFLVADTSLDAWQPAYTNNTASTVWFAPNAHAGLSIVGVAASTGYDAPGNLGFRGDFQFDVYLMEFPPVTGIDAPSENESLFQPSSQVDAGTVTSTTSKTLLIAWTNNLAFADAQGPFQMTPIDHRFTVLSDDGILAVATAIVDAPGEYSFTAIYNGAGFWTAGLVAFRLTGGSSESAVRPAPVKRRPLNSL